MYKSMSPHIARSMREVHGYDIGEEKCQHCGAMTATLNRQRTAYEDEEMNWATLCPDCQQESDVYWDEMWAEYYGSR